MKCDKCGNEVTEIHHIQGGDWACLDCLCPGECGPENSVPFSLEYVHVKGYGKVLKGRLDELNRRVALNFNPKTMTYNVGRRGENGRIQERPPNYA